MDARNIPVYSDRKQYTLGGVYSELFPYQDWEPCGMGSGATNTLKVRATTRPTTANYMVSATYEFPMIPKPGTNPCTIL